MWNSSSVTTTISVKAFVANARLQAALHPVTVTPSAKEPTDFKPMYVDRESKTAILANLTMHVLAGTVSLDFVVSVRLRMLSRDVHLGSFVKEHLEFKLMCAGPARAMEAPVAVTMHAALENAS